MIAKSRLFRRIIALAKRLGGLSDDLVGAKGDLAQLAEDYELELGLCRRCGAPLDAELRCPVCYKQDRLGKDELR